MSEALLLTLGHNSSAVLVRDNKIVCGYENERISHKKSDSAFPLEAILECRRFITQKNLPIYISHWFLNLSIPLNEQGKWYDESIVKQLFPNSEIHTLNKDFTHHDAHMLSAVNFAGDAMPFDTHIIVADGFGSYGEVLSIYENVGSKYKLVHRAHGFSKSLGLLYQYATSYLGLKENQDEYKLLGYEAYIDDIEMLAEDMMVLNENIVEFTNKIATALLTNVLIEEFDPMININALPTLKLTYREYFDELANTIHVTDEYELRVVIAYFVQTVIENVLSIILEKFHINNVILVGGIFLNVKLNNHIASCLMGKTCVMPLSGDQGAALGVYCRHNQLEWPGHLYWGLRNLNLSATADADNIYVIDDPMYIVGLLAEGKIVNLVRGNMEYGPRALCNTSTLALPDLDNVEYINDLNGRSTIMPMAPVMMEDKADTFFKDKDKIVKSLEYMICARDCHDWIDPSNYGVTHRMPFSGIRTCRPQLIKDDPFMEAVLKPFSYLINTSFNEHGTPIVFSNSDIRRCHKFQQDRDGRNRTVTVVVRNEI